MTAILHVVLGLPASGKTTFARALARKRRAALLDIDIATEPLVRAAMGALAGDPDDRDSPIFKRAFRQPIYDTLFAIADANLPHTEVIVTGPFTKELGNSNWLDQIAEARPTPCSVRAYYVRCDDTIRRSRMAARGNPRDRSKLENWKKHLAYYGDQPSPAFPHVAIDTGEENAIERFLATTSEV